MPMPSFMHEPSEYSLKSASSVSSKWIDFFLELSMIEFGQSMWFWRCGIGLIVSIL